MLAGTERMTGSLTWVSVADSTRRYNDDAGLRGLERVTEQVDEVVLGCGRDGCQRSPDVSICITPVPARARREDELAHTSGLQ